MKGTLKMEASCPGKSLEAGATTIDTDAVAGPAFRRRISRNGPDNSWRPLKNRHPWPKYIERKRTA